MICSWTFFLLWEMWEEDGEVSCVEFGIFVCLSSWEQTEEATRHNRCNQVRGHFNRTTWRRKIKSWNSKAFASEFQENLKEIGAGGGHLPSPCPRFFINWKAINFKKIWKRDFINMKQNMCKTTIVNYKLWPTFFFFFFST